MAGGWQGNQRRQLGCCAAQVPRPAALTGPKAAPSHPPLDCPQLTLPLLHPSLPPTFPQAAEVQEVHAEKAEKAAALEEEGRNAARDAVFEKGQSRRIWGELYKVVDSSDVIIQVRASGRGAHIRCSWTACLAPSCQLALIASRCIVVAANWQASATSMPTLAHGSWLPAFPPPLPSPLQVLDARDPNGTRCRHLEQHLKKNARHKHLLLLLNKCDLVSAMGEARGGGGAGEGQESKQ